MIKLRLLRIGVPIMLLLGFAAIDANPWVGVPISLLPFYALHYWPEVSR